MTLTFVYRSFEVMSIIASHSPLNNPETVRGLVPKNTNRKWLMGIKWSRDRLRHVTPKGQTRDLIPLQRNISKTAGDAM